MMSDKEENDVDAMCEFERAVEASDPSDIWMDKDMYIQFRRDHFVELGVSFVVPEVLLYEMEDLDEHEKAVDEVLNKLIDDGATLPIDCLGIENDCAPLDHPLDRCKRCFKEYFAYKGK